MRYTFWLFSLLLLCSPLHAGEGMQVQLTDATRIQSVGKLTEFWEQRHQVPKAAAVYEGSLDIPWRRSITDIINIGYSQNPYWFRFQVENLTEASDWYFALDLPLVRELDIYIQQGGKVISFYHLGDRFEFDARPVDHRNFVVPLTLAQGEQLTFYIRIDSTYAIQFPGYLIEESRFIKSEITTHLLHGLFFGFLLVMFFYNSFLFFSTRDLSYLYYVCFTLSIGFFQFSQHGFGYQYLWPSEIWFQHRSTPVFCSISFVFGGLFVQAFLNTRQSTPRLHGYITWFIGGGLILLAVALFVSEFWAQALNACLSVVGSILLFVTAMRCWQLGVPSARFFVFAWFIFLVAIITFAGNKMGLFPRNFFTEYGMQIGSAIELSLLSFALADRINKSRRKQEELLQQSQMYEQIAKAANERALNFERMGKQRLEKNIKSRTEQLQNALKELTAANRQLEALSTFDPLTGVRNLNFFNDKLNEEWTRAARDKTWLSLILVSVDEFDLIGDRYGYVAAEEILKTLANALTERVARPADLVARSATAEFAILMPNTTPEGAAFVAEAFYEYVSSEPLNLGVCSISVSVSISVVGRQPLSNEGWMEYLDQAQSLLIEAIEEGGSRIKTGEERTVALD